MPMNCDQAIEFLPWLLNGTLEATERDEVRRHLATCERCRAALNDTRDAWTIFGQHLPGEALVTLAYGEIPAGVDPAVAERHLASCPECAAELELARTSRRLEEDDRIAVFPGARSRQEKGADGGSRTWRAAALAAGLAAVIASAGWVHEFQRTSSSSRLAQANLPAPVSPAPMAVDGSLRQKVDELMARAAALQASQQQAEKRAQDNESQLAEIRKQNELPHAGALVILDTAAVVRDSGAQEAPAPKEVQRSPFPLTVLLQAAKDGEGPTGRKAEIVDKAGTKLPVQDTLTPNESGYYALTLPAGFLKPGRYAIRLRDPKSGETRETYAIQVR
jgi:hypothetical protein